MGEKYFQGGRGGRWGITRRESNGKEKKKNGTREEGETLARTCSRGPCVCVASVSWGSKKRIRDKDKKAGLTRFFVLFQQGPAENRGEVVDSIPFPTKVSVLHC